MTSTFTVRAASSYEQLMGRWSRRLAPKFIDFAGVGAGEKIIDPRITISQADATALPFADNAFDRALALLVLHFVPEAGKAVAEMRRVVRPGGVVAAVVWDLYGGMTGMRTMIDTVAALSESGRQMRSRY